VQQSGEYVYYISPDRNSTIRVIDDMIRPNGIVGTADGGMLYVTDHGAEETYRYSINSDGTLSDKQLFASVGADGMTIDSQGNVYLCENGVLVYDSAGNLLETISVPQAPTNVSFGDSDNQTLFITTRTSLYALEMDTTGASYSQEDDSLSSESSESSGSGGGCFIDSMEMYIENFAGSA
jgi:gluconolactonase